MPANPVRTLTPGTSDRNKTDSGGAYWELRLLRLLVAHQRETHTHISPVPDTRYRFTNTHKWRKEEEKEEKNTIKIKNVKIM